MTSTLYFMTLALHFIIKNHQNQMIIMDYTKEEVNFKFDLINIKFEDPQISCYFFEQYYYSNYSK